MSMLSDRELLTLAKSRDLVSPFVENRCEGATINLTLDSFVRRYTSSDTIIPGKEVTTEEFEKFDISKEGYLLQPGESILVQTHEFIRLPDNMSGMLLEKYSVKLLGLMISPAAYMNPGWYGKVTLLAVNHSSAPIHLVPGIEFCQLAVFELSSEALIPYSKQDRKYLGAMDVSISKIHLDRGIQDFLRSRGIRKFTDEMVSELSTHLVSNVSKSAKRLANLLREEEFNK
jgi:dCTP deaminase